MTRFTEISIPFIVIIGVFLLGQAVFLYFMKFKPENIYKYVSKVGSAWLVSKLLCLNSSYQITLN
jgi:hypothetical protein